VADLGAGFGWLTFRLAQVGYRVVAVEASVDDLWGLGAAEAHYAPHTDFYPVQGDLEHAPLQPDKLALVILNASLHYARDLEALRRCARALTGGRLIVLDTPIARRRGRTCGRSPGATKPHDAVGPACTPLIMSHTAAGPSGACLAEPGPRFSFPMVVADRR
jgi:SAM-dependent methyltransferase